MYDKGNDENFQTTILRRHNNNWHDTGNTKRKIIWWFRFTLTKCNVLRDLISLAQFKKREKNPRSVTFSKVAPPWVSFTFFKLCKWYQIAQRIANDRRHSVLQGISPTPHPEIFTSPPFCQAPSLKNLSDPPLLHGSSLP